MRLPYEVDEMSEKTLFIGGPEDGSRYKIIEYQREFYAQTVSGTPLDEPSFRIQDHIYTLKMLKSGDKICKIYVHESIGDNDLIQLLIDNYKRGRP